MIARVLGNAPKWTIAELEAKYPPRSLPDGAMVTRFAPSPTGFMHIGGLYQALIDYKQARGSGGVFILRVEDTDTKREVAGTEKIIFDSLSDFGLDPDEGPLQGGNYGPYRQSERKDIYHSVAADLLARGLAYPCFLSQEEMDAIRERQKAAGLPTGIYGEYARWRNATDEEIKAELDKGAVPSIRLWSLGNKDQKIFCKDAVRGSMAFPENDEDIVLIKSTDSLPTYHFAHLTDDHFMRVTHVVRDASYLSSLSLHYQLFKAMGWEPPVYAHTSTLDKIDSETGTQRKLSKRKDPEASVENFIKDGWPAEAVMDYLMNIADSGYEDAKAKNPSITQYDYQFKIKKIPTSGALFDWKKLEWWSKEFIAKLSVPELVRRIVEYGFKGDEKYLAAILGIERDNPKRIRKDFINWKQTLEEISYFFDDQFAAPDSAQINKEVLTDFLQSFDFKDQKDLWWEKIQKIAAARGLPAGDAAMALRVAITGRTMAPDLYSVIKAMGEARVRSRIEKVLK